MTPDADEKLRAAFGQLGRGERAGLEQIWAEYARPLHNYAFALTGSQEEADDVLGEVMAALAAQGRKLARVREPRAYLFAAVRNEVRTRHRKWLRRGHDTHTEDRVEGWSASEGLAVREAVLALPAEQREVVVLHIWAGLTFEEAARVLGISPNTAASRYRYGLEKLRELLGDDD